MTDPRKIVRGYSKVAERVGKSRIQVWRDIKAGKFPPPLELGPNSVGWFEDEIATWLESRPRRTYTPKNYEAIAGEADPSLVEQLVTPNALRQRRYRERQNALRNADVTPASALCNAIDEEDEDLPHVANAKATDVL